MNLSRIIFLALIGFSSTSFAQNEMSSMDDMGRIALRPMLMYSPELPETNRLDLRNKVAQIASYNGLGATGAESRFVLAAKSIVINKNIVESAPPMFIYTMEISFYMVDNIEHKIFSQFTLAKRGVGGSESKAISSVIQQIEPTDARFNVFLEKGKESILEYYNTNCDIIIEKATALIASNENKKGNDLLLSVPSVSRECYDRAMEIVRENNNGDPVIENRPIRSEEVKDDDGSLDWIGR